MDRIGPATELEVNIQKSKFKFKHLKQLSNKQSAYQSPLAVISHIDVNAFFAQVEQLRTGLSPQDPVVCVQWNTLIAVSYSARDFGVNRMDTLETAKLKCPNLKPIHTAVFRKGDNYWRYHDDDDKFPDPLSHKVSLDPYRRESRKLLKIIKSKCDLVEKASVDECFMDLGRSVIEKAFEMFPELVENFKNLEPDEHLPPLRNALKLPLYGVLIDDSDLILNDYDDLFIIIGSILMNELRLEIKEKIGYTTSCGVSRTKTVAKLASGFRKPDNQTIVRNTKIQIFLENFKISDFWSMGGKTGEFIKDKLSTDDNTTIRSQFDLAELTEHLEDSQLSLKVHELVRGVFQQPLSERIVLKTMNSNKNIRGSSGKSFEDAIQWIRVFAADLKQRIVELNDENNSNSRAKTISMSFRNFRERQSRSKQSPLPLVNLEQLEETLYKYGVNLLKMLEAQFGNIYPLSNLNMTISNFETSDNSDQTILNFAKKGDINDAFKQIKNANSENGSEDEVSKPIIKDDYQYKDDVITCLRCNQMVEDVTEHSDYHYALKLMKEINGSGSIATLNGNNQILGPSYQNIRRSTPPSKVTKSNSRKSTKKKSISDKGQSKLPF